MTTVSYNLSAGDLFFDGQAIWRVLDTYPDNVRAQHVGDDSTRRFSYEEIDGCLALESPEDYEKLDLRGITEKTAEWLAQNPFLTAYATTMILARINIGWPSIDAYDYLAVNPASSERVLWALLNKSYALAALVAKNPKLSWCHADTLMRRRDDKLVRRNLARYYLVCDRNSWVPLAPCAVSWIPGIVSPDLS